MVADDNIPEGKLFSRVYLRPSELIQESERARNRFANMFEELSSPERSKLADFIKAELGVQVPVGYNGYLWERWCRSCEMRDLLDALTAAVHLRRAVAGGDAQKKFVARVGRVFDEEGLHFRIDTLGGIHYRVDEQLERQIASTLLGLGAERFKSVRTEIDKSVEAIQQAQTDGKTAVQRIFEAAEILYRIALPQRTRMTRSNALQDMPAISDAAYASNPIARASAEDMKKSFGEWIEACHHYRHGQGQPEPNQPPIGLAVLLVSQGLGFIRWLAELTPPPSA